MKRYTLLIQDKDEREWKFFTENKEEQNIDQALLNLIKKSNEVKKNETKN